MESRAKVAGHPVHQMLIVFPLGLLATAVIFDIITIATGEPRWMHIAEYMIGAGVIGGLVAAIFGFIDWWAIPGGTRAKAIGGQHALVNASVLLLFTASWFLRLPAPGAPPTSALVLSFAGAGLSLIGGWLGGELVARLGVGVDNNAGLNAPSSLTRPSEDVKRRAA